ncbi:MAG: hypothetical protein HXS54_06400, partial [Theionarchaea archaeon]|nr:hypothetical protein [Theionarchaea archaeon]
MYFENPGKENTEGCIDMALKRCEELGITNVVVASTTGYTIEKLMEKGTKNVICVTHSYGFKKDKEDEFELNREELM